MRYRPTTLALACLLPCILASQIPLQAQHADYKTAVPTRDSLVRLTWSTRDQAERAHAILLDQGVDVWLAKPLEITLRLKSVPGRSGEIEMGRYDSTSDVVARQLGAVGYETVLDSVQEYVETTLPTVEQARVESDAAAARMPPTRIVGTLQRATSVPDSIHDAYHPYDTLNEIMQSLADEFPGYARVVSLGQSAEGREIRGLKVTNESFVPGHDNTNQSPHYVDDDGVHATRKKGHKNKKIKRKIGFVVAAGQHAREWIAPASTLFMMHDLLLSTRQRTSSDGPSSASLLDFIEFTFVPTTNPDGYAYTWAPDGDRLWRKNRMPVTGSNTSVNKNDNDEEQCYGVDLNRNWGFHFEPGTRPNPCSDAYPGAKAFEAPELQALRDYLLDKRNNVQAYLDVHSFGQMLMYPFSYSCSETVPNEENLFEGVVGAAKALRAVHGRQFETGSVCQVSLTAPGDAIDWTYASAKIRWSFAVELRGGIYGFLLPATQIRPSGEEMSAALASLGDFVVRKEQGQRFASRFWQDDEDEDEMEV